MPTGKVLVVDDARAIVETMSKALQRLGVAARDVVTAGTPAEALKAFKEHQPFVVFMDVDLAGQKGDEAAMRILEIAPMAKVVLVTGMSPNDARVRAVVSAGAYAVVEKPVRLTRLREIIDLIETEEKGLRRVQ